jgi:hypothetical protein
MDILRVVRMPKINEKHSNIFVLSLYYYIIITSVGFHMFSNRYFFLIMKKCVDSSQMIVCFFTKIFINEHSSINMF